MFLKWLHDRSYKQFQIEGIPFIKLWRRHPAHRAITAFVFNQNPAIKTHEDELNFFNGFPFKRHPANMKFCKTIHRPFYSFI